MKSLKLLIVSKNVERLVPPPAILKIIMIIYSLMCLACVIYVLISYSVIEKMGLSWENSYVYRKIRTNVTVKRLPDALVIGVKKCGTRALIEYLRIHPDVRAKGAEVQFFDKYYHMGMEWYRDEMVPSLASQITIEKTATYWSSEPVPGRVFAMNPGIKLLAIVRDPVTRAISDYNHFLNKAHNRHTPKFEHMALFNSTVDSTGVKFQVDASWSPIQLGVYALPLKRWLEKFPRSRLLLINGDRLLTNPASEMAKVQEFLGLKQVITEKHFYFNATKGFYCVRKSENQKPHCLGKSKGRKHPHIDPLVIEKLREYYRPFNKHFYQLSGINFGWP